jgi:beta-lactamase superfamily II metal-dependent hydrolase
MKRSLWVAAALAAVVLPARAAKTLDIYFIDVEGGQSTLIVTPAGESLLVDTGYAGNNGRDAGRILAAARDAGIKQVDYLLLTHFHPDHIGGLTELARQIPIQTFVDHGDMAEPTTADPSGEKRAFDAYLAVKKPRHVEPKPGDRLPLKGLEIVVVSSAGATIAKPIAGAGQATPGCPQSARPAQNATENPRSTGVHVRYGRFRFVDLGDLSGKPLYELFCPNNLLGPADVYLVPHHGGADVSEPAYLAAVRPRVAIMNNGATKGGSREMFATLQSATRLDDVWQLDKSRTEGAQNFGDERIANLDETTGHWLKISANEDGSFRVTNGRTGAGKDYPRP